VPISRHVGLGVPVTAARALATSDDSLPRSTGSGAVARMIDRWVAARW
jgi:hypothetical protein